MKIIESLIQAKAAQAPPLLKNIYTEKALHEQCAHELEEDIERLESDRLASLFAKYAPIAGQQPSEYKTRLLNGDNGDIALCGIRFRGMDISQPFITVAATLKPLTIDSINALVEDISKAFADFKPHYVQFYVASYLAIEPANFSVAHWDNRILANTLDTLIASSVADITCLSHVNLSHAKYELLPAKSMFFYEQYKRAYTKLFESSPQHASMTELKSLEDMTEWMVQRFVHLLYINDELAGVMVIEPDTSLGMTWFYVIENLVFAEYRGQGLGKWMQQAMIYQLANDPNRPLDRQKTDMLFGTIHSNNTSAIECAKSVGREDIGGYLWVATGIK